MARSQFQMQLSIFDSVQALSYSDKLQSFRKFCNALRCPLCAGQLDGNIHPKRAELYCVNNNEEYSGHWLPGYNQPATERIKFWYYPYEYVISVGISADGNYHTIVERYNMDASPIHKNSTRVELFVYHGPRILAFYKRMEEEQFLKKLKTIMVFS